MSEFGYLNLLKDILENGNERSDRTNVGTISLFGKFIEFDLSNNRIPVLTTKRVPIRIVVEELLWFLRGETNSKILEAKNVNIWKGNSSREFLDSRGLYFLDEGEIGRGYGHQWRNFGGTVGQKNGYDQIDNIVNMLKNDPFSRRIFMSAWNPDDLSQMALPCCHVSLQMYVEEKDNIKYLSSHLYMRSADCAIGLPFNILSYSILTYIFAKKCDMVPKKLCISIGDAHIYKNHIDGVNIQLKRTIFDPPDIIIADSVKDKKWEEITVDDIIINNYACHGTIKMPMNV
jgi:thymidylate synthase